jgi:hypothetical protein
MNLNPPADVLFVTGPELGRKAFTLWQTMFDWLNITLDFWDAERYNGFSLDLETLERHNETRSVVGTVTSPYSSLHYNELPSTCIMNHTLWTPHFFKKLAFSSFVNQPVEQ